MENETDRLIEEQFKTLPFSMRQAIRLMHWKDLARNIAVSNGLDLDQTESFVQETMLILYAFENPENYIPNLMNSLGVSEEKASDIAESAVKRIFNPIMERAEELDTPTQNAHSNKSDLEVSNLPEIAPEIHPSPIEQEVKSPAPVINDIPITSIKELPQAMVRRNWKTDMEELEKKISVPDYRYQGQDPYREPLQ